MMIVCFNREREREICLLCESIRNRNVGIHFHQTSGGSDPIKMFVVMEREAKKTMSSFRSLGEIYVTKHRHFGRQSATSFRFCINFT